MLDNRNTALVGHKVILVPYRREHVPQYHKWMTDPLIQQQTASEPLSLGEEYAMQQSWAVDDDKLTFIILAKDNDTQASSSVVRDSRQMLASCRMIGDVNVFFNPCYDNEDVQDGCTAQPSSGQSTGKLDAECEIMIAEPDARRKGMAREALQMMLNYVTASSTKAGSKLPVPASWLSCKISLDNDASIALFESLGFARHKISQIWQEVEMRFTATAESGGLFPGSIVEVMVV